MAITYKYGMNAALPYNVENNMEPYAITIANSNALFLTNAPIERTFNINERSALYFLCINTELDLTAVYESFDENGLSVGAISVPLTGALSFFNAIPVNQSFIHSDAVKLTVQIITTVTDLVKTEKRTFYIDRTTYCDAKQYVWLNSLGGYDSYVFEAAKTFNASTQTNTQFISADNNFFAPNRIESFLSKEIKHGYKASTLARNRDEYAWLLSGIIESIDVFEIEEDFYIPINVKSQGYTIETFSKDLIVTFSYEYAFKKNIQTR